MSVQAFQDSWWLFTRARGVGIMLRMLVLVSPLAALMCTRMAGGSAVVVELCVVVLTGWCVVVPDSHVGLLVVLLVGVGWLFSVDDASSPWALAAALALLVFHTSLAAASVAAPGAVWSSSMRRRWLRRAGVLAVTCGATWLLVAAVNLSEVAGSSALVVAAFVVLALAGLWARDATFDHRVPPPQPSDTAPTE
jgi:hypothetical protein